MVNYKTIEDGFYIYIYILICIVDFMMAKSNLTVNGLMFDVQRSFILYLKVYFTNKLMV